MTPWVRARAVRAAVLAGGVALLGFLVAGRPAPPPIEVRPREPVPSPTAFIYVHMDGAVASPGVYSLPAGSRLFEALESAGGATEAADLRELNLAARVNDGQKFAIPERPTPPDAAEPGSAAPPTPTVARPPVNQNGTAALINLNTATQRILESLPGIGPVTATRIIEYRQANGPFTRVEQLRDARLVNTSVFTRIRGLVTVD